MLNVSDATKNAYRNYGSHKSIEIRIPDVNVILHNEDILSQSLSLSEAIEKDTNLTFVGCIASALRFKCADIVQNVKGKYIECDVTADNTEIVPLFRGYIDSVTNSSHEQFTMEIVAYDTMQKINTWDVTDWYNKLNFPITIKNMRDSFFQYLNSYFPITQKTDALTNDMATVNKTIENKAIKGADIIQKICEINGSPGRVNRYGVFEYVHLTPGTETIYPAEDLYPRNDLYPMVGNENEVATKAMYMKINFENYRVSAISKIQLVDKDGTIASEVSSQSQNMQGIVLDDTLYPAEDIYPAEDLYPSDGGNTLAISNNPLIWGKTKEELDEIATNLANTVYGIWYVPMELNCVGLPYLECGDFVTCSARRSIVYTYVLNRNLKGAQALTDNYISEGDRFHPEYEQDTENRINANEKAIEVENIRAVQAETINANNIQAVDIKANRIDADLGNFKVLTAQEFNAVHASINTLDAHLIQTDQLVATKASISDLEATNARVGTLQADLINTNNIVAQKADISSLNALSITVSNLSARMITTDYLESHWVETYGIRTTGFQFRGAYLDWVEFDGHRLIGVK